MYREISILLLFPVLARKFILQFLCMLNYTTWLVSKMDPVKYIFEKPVLTRRIARWQVLLFEFDIVYVTQKAIKGMPCVDSPFQLLFVHLCLKEIFNGEFSLESAPDRQVFKN